MVIVKSPVDPRHNALNSINVHRASGDDCVWTLNRPMYCMLNLTGVDFAVINSQSLTNCDEIKIFIAVSCFPNFSKIYQTSQD